MNLSVRDIAIVLAGLRTLQKNGVPAEIHDILTNDGEFAEPTDDEIDELCERINCD